MTALQKDNDSARLDESVISTPDGKGESLVVPEANKEAEYYRILHLECAQLYANTDRIRILLERSTELAELHGIGFHEFHSRVTNMMSNANGLSHEMTKDDGASPETVQRYESRFIKNIEVIDQLLKPFIENIALNYPGYYSFFEDFVVHFIRVKYITQHPSEVRVEKAGDTEWITGVGKNKVRITNYTMLI